MLREAARVARAQRARHHPNCTQSFGSVPIEFSHMLDVDHRQFFTVDSLRELLAASFERCEVEQSHPLDEMIASLVLPRPLPRVYRGSAALGRGAPALLLPPAGRGLGRARVTRVLVVSGEPVGGAMAGPAIRALELARVLAEHCRVTLAAPGRRAGSRTPRLELLEAAPRTSTCCSAPLRTPRRGGRPAAAGPAAALRRRSCPIRYVADLYNPLMIELLEALADAGAPRERSLARRLTRAVFAQCAVGRLRDLRQREAARPVARRPGPVGPDRPRLLPPRPHLPGVRRRRALRPAPTARRAHGRPVLKGVWPGIGADDQVLLWGGGIWRWLDALTPIRAVERLAAEGRRVHLFFLGVERPAADPRAIPSSAGEAIAYARERGLEGRCVHFNHGWVPYEERQSYLLEADLGISAHHDHLEARFSFRTRVLDYLWAGLPMVLTRGRLDGRAGRAARRSARPSTPEDDEGFAAACAELLDDADRRPRRRRRVREVAPSFRWEEAARPLVDYCLDHRERPGAAQAAGRGRDGHLRPVPGDPGPRGGHRGPARGGAPDRAQRRARVAAPRRLTAERLSRASADARARARPRIGRAGPPARSARARASGAAASARAASPAAAARPRRARPGARAGGARARRARRRPTWR